MVLEPCTSSGELAVGTTAVCAQPALLCSVILTPAAAVSTVKIYDNASAASGTILAEASAAASGASVVIPFTYAMFAAKGLTVVVTGSAATAIIGYQKENG